MPALESEADPLSSLPPPRRRYVEGDYSTFGEYENDELERILVDPAISPADRVALANEMLTRRMDVSAANEILYSILRGFEGNQTRYRAAIALARMGDWNAEVWRALRHIADRYPITHGDARMAVDILTARDGLAKGGQRSFSAPIGAVVGVGQQTARLPDPIVAREYEPTEAPPPPSAQRRPLPAANQPEQWEKLPAFAAERLSVRSAAGAPEVMSRVPALRPVDEDDDQPRRVRRGRRSSRNKPLTKVVSHPLVSYVLVGVLILSLMLLLATCMPIQNPDELERMGVIEN